MSSAGQRQRKKQEQQQHLEGPKQQLVATSDYWSGCATTTTASEFEPLLAGGRLSMAPPLGHSLADERMVLGQASFGAQAPQLLADAEQDYYLQAETGGVGVSELPELASELSPAQQRHQQQVLLANMQLQQEQQQQQMMFAQAELGPDYDDYAIPSDENCCRLDRSQVELVRLIGEGQKGFVFLGKLQSRDGSSIIDVAIKTLKYETEQLIERLMNEAATMKQLEHPHIIKFIGMCPETPALIAMELAQFGELKHYLKVNRNLIKCSQLVLFTFQISTALSYLESKNYVHRDVAARNVLVCSHNCVKLADFGLSRNLQNLQILSGTKAATAITTTKTTPSPNLATTTTSEQSLYVAAPRVKLPVRWLAPESLVFRRFTSASDVWMFAVCAWELFHFGQLRPWAELRNQQVLLAIEAGQRPQRPPACPERLYQLMLKCWSYAPVQRPKFREIKQCIWSVYLSERTREQLELERLEQLRQTYLLAARQQQQQQQQQQVFRHLQQNQNQNQKLLMTYSTPSNYSSAGTTDNEQSTSPCSSAFNSMGRNYIASRHLHQQQQLQQRQRQMEMRLHQQQSQMALQSQLSRFKQRQATSMQQQQQQQQVQEQQKQQKQQQQVPPNFRPHLLKKQRSQGAIGMTSVQREEQRDWCSGKHGQGAASKAGKTTRARDDHAVELARRQSSATGHSPTTALRGHQALHAPYLESEDDDDEDEDEDEEEEEGESEDDQDSAVGSPTVPLAFGGRVMSASPALTIDARSQSRMVSLEPAYEGVPAAGSEAPPLLAGARRPASRASTGGGQVAMLRANFDPARGSPRTSPMLTNATPSPVPTSNSNLPTSRPLSWRNSSNFNNNRMDLINLQAEAQQQAAGGQLQRVKQQPQQQRSAPDQLGQMLRALRLTPMKAKLKQAPEQSVRIVRREESKSPHKPDAPTCAEPAEIGSQRQARLKLHDAESEQQQQQQAGLDDQKRQLMVHRRLLGRIRPSSAASDPRLDSPSTTTTTTATTTSTTRAGERDVERAQAGRATSSRTARQHQLAHQNKSVEAVDHSLQILESLMSASGPLQNSRAVALTSGQPYQSQVQPHANSASLSRRRAR